MRKPLLASFCCAFILLLGIVKSIQANTLSLYADYGLSHVGGFTQIPRGGDYQTTSTQRPSFKELGIEYDTLFEMGLNATHKRYFADMSFRYLRPQGDTTLSSSLLTHAQYIPAGSPFYKENRYHWYTLTFGRAFPCKHWEIAPIVQLNWLHFHYQFWSPTRASFRNFSTLAPNIGLKIKHALFTRGSVEFTASGSLPFTNLTICSLDMLLQYPISLSPNITLIPRLIIGAFRIDQEDSQTIPNHFRFEGYPYAAIGLAIEYGKRP